MQNLLTGLIVVIEIFAVIWFLAMILTIASRFAVEEVIEEVTEEVTEVFQAVEVEKNEEWAETAVAETADFTLPDCVVRELRLQGLPPMPTATAIALPLLPTISVEQADQNLDEQITALLIADQFPLECRSLLTPSTAPAKNKSPRKAKAKNIQQSNTIASKSTEEKTPNKKPSLTDIRNLCSTNKIKWQNVHGKNQHLTKTEMIDALKNQGLTL